MQDPAMENFITQFRAAVRKILDDAPSKGLSIRQTVREIDQRLNGVKRKADPSQKGLVDTMERIADEEFNKYYTSIDPILDEKIKRVMEADESTIRQYYMKQARRPTMTI